MNSIDPWTMKAYQNSYWLQNQYGLDLKKKNIYMDGIES